MTIHEATIYKILQRTAGAVAILFAVAGCAGHSAHDQIVSCEASPVHGNADTLLHHPICTNTLMALHRPDMHTVLYSPQGPHIVQERKEAGRVSLFLDGRELLTCDEVSQFRFSGDGSRTSCMGRYGETWYAIVDGRKLAESDHESQGPTFSPNGKRMAYVRKSDKGVVCVCDDQEIGPYRVIRRIDFSGDDKHWFCLAWDYAQTWTLIVDGQVVDTIKTWAFPRASSSPDGRRYALWSTNKVGGGGYVFVDGRRYTNYKAVGPVSFSPDGSRFLYVGIDDRGAHLIVDGEETATYDQITFATFAPDNKRMGFYAKKSGGRWVVVTDKKESAEYEGLEQRPIIFSSDARRTGYAIKDKGKERVVVDGEAKVSYDAVYQPIFSRDGRKCCYAGWRDHKWYVVVDDVDFEVVDSPLGLAFSRDGKHVFYSTVGQEPGVYVDDHLLIQGNVTPPEQCDDENHIAFLLTDESGIWWKSVPITGQQSDGRRD